LIEGGIHLLTVMCHNLQIL